MKRSNQSHEAGETEKATEDDYAIPTTEEDFRVKCMGIAAHFNWSEQTFEEWYPKALAAWREEMKGAGNGTGRNIN